MLKFDFSKPYDFNQFENEIYKMWENSGYFNPDLLPGKRIKKYIIYMPLPNITGNLHMGHALNNTLQDILVRYYRMNGYKTLWFPGTDHAGIATQYKVEKELQKENKSRFAIGREKFIEEVWKWKKKYGNIIVDQLKKLGVSADWSRFRFTMDDNYSKEVISAFIHYYKKGWVYRGIRTVNWCPRCETSLSDLELEYKEEETNLYYIKYPLVSRDNQSFTYDNNENFVSVATTRPETMLGDVALAVNPKDKRLKEFIGKKAIIPLLGKVVPIIADRRVDPNFGTGVVKITPAHDILDFEIAKDHRLPIISVINERGKITEDVLKKYNGLNSKEARKLILEDLKFGGFLINEEKYKHNISVCYRCGREIEPLPSKQWFLKMDKLAGYALSALRRKLIKINPKNFSKVYISWLSAVKDWTISRQLWWGHRIPVWECKCANQKIENNNIDRDFIVSLKKPLRKCKKCGSDYEQVDDVLDTWFSSALWPFAGLSRRDKKFYYPGTSLVTARDILNLWVSRMVFSGIEFMNNVPFRNVFIHGTVLTKDGKRMSKSLGTGVDPMDYISNYGADATRFGIIWQAVGQDIKWDETSLLAGKKLNNKIWNAARFVVENIKNEENIGGGKIICKTNEDKLIISEVKKTKKLVERYVEDFKMAKALRCLYNFFWKSFCDRYIEQAKKQILIEKYSLNTKKILYFVLLESLKMFHPFLPFVTEAVYQNIKQSIKTNSRNSEFLMIRKW
jgi:valyl-tRNA synthetase